MVVGSGLDHCSLCMQKKNNLCASVCSSRATEEVPQIFWIMSELSHDLWIMCRSSGISLGWPTFKGKQGVFVRVSQAQGKSHCNPRP